MKYSCHHMLASNELKKGTSVKIRAGQKVTAWHL